MVLYCKAFRLGYRRGFDLHFDSEIWDFSEQRFVGNNDYVKDVNPILKLPTTYFQASLPNTDGEVRLLVANSCEALFEMRTLSGRRRIYEIPDFAKDGFGFESDRSPLIFDFRTDNFFRVDEDQVSKEVLNWAREKYGEDYSKYVMIFPERGAKPISLQEYITSTQK